jgi:hypothetical protein
MDFLAKHFGYYSKYLVCVSRCLPDASQMPHRLLLQDASNMDFSGIALSGKRQPEGAGRRGEIPNYSCVRSIFMVADVQIHEIRFLD